MRKTTSSTKTTKTKLLTSLDDFEHIKLRGKEKLGKGSFASVRLIRHKQSGKFYALKEVFPKRLISDLIR